MSGKDAIRTVTVVGGGVVAWSAAASLKRRIPSLAVTVVPTPVAPGALADRMISTLPSVHGFHRDIGLTDEDTIVRAESGLRLGSLYEGWAQDAPQYVHAYGAYGAPIGGVAFHQLWLRDRSAHSLPPFDHFSAAAELARSGRSPDKVSGDVEFGLQLTLERYVELMRAYALHLGAKERAGVIRHLSLHADGGFIEALNFEDGSRETADLYVDCTGPDALLRSRIGGPKEDWSSWLPCDRLHVSSSPSIPKRITLDHVDAVPNGWQFTVSSPRHALAGSVYSSAHASGEQVTSEAIEVRQGRWREQWSANCVAIGDAAVTVEPLEWTNLHLAHSQIDRMVSMMPGRDCAPIELAEFNRQCGQEADRVRDFLCLHYVCAKRPEPFWKDAAAIKPPPSLEHTLSLFAERGRLPYHEEETFTRDSWLAVLLGQGFEPRRLDPMTDLVPPAEAQRAMAAMLQSLQAFHLTLPPAGELELNPRGVR